MAAATICDHLSKNPTYSRKHVFEEKNKVKLHLQKGSNLKTCSWEFKNLCFILLQYASHMVYNAINVNKIVIISSTTYLYV